MATTTTQRHSAYQVCPPSIFKPLRTSHLSTGGSSSARPASKPSFYSSFLPLHSVLPKRFDDMYTADVLANKDLLTSLGRPLFTKRSLVDWAKNDTRSLLIVEALRPEWKGKVPQIIEPGYRVQVLPFDANDDKIIQVLVESDLYREMEFERAFLVQTAHYTVQAARERHGSTMDNAVLTKPEWRNIIENYLLNLACEAQCRLDFKKSCAYLKRHKLYQVEQQARKASNMNTSSSSVTINTAPAKKSTSPLLKKAILTSLSTSPDFPTALDHHHHQQQPQRKPASVSLTRQEKQQIWVQVQTELYARLGLNWQPDELVWFFSFNGTPINLLELLLSFLLLLLLSCIFFVCLCFCAIKGESIGLCLPSLPYRTSYYLFCIMRWRLFIFYFWNMLVSICLMNILFMTFINESCMNSMFSWTVMSIKLARLQVLASVGGVDS